MTMAHNQILVAAALTGALTLSGAYAQTPAANGAPTPGFNNKIPEQILTPDKVETRLGTLNFVDGVPTVETTQKVYDNLDFLRGVEVFLNFIPAASIEGIRLGHASMGSIKSNQAIIFDQLMDSNPLFLTGNTDTVYCMAMLDLQTDGPTVVEVPPGSGPGTVDDARRMDGWDFSARFPFTGTLAGWGAGKLLSGPCDPLPMFVTAPGETDTFMTTSGFGVSIEREYKLNRRPTVLLTCEAHAVRVWYLIKGLAQV
jgi:Protein of unknown function (DUF1254)